MFKSLFSKNSILPIFKAANNNGGGSNNDDVPLIHVNEIDSASDKVHPYVKFERIYGWLQSLLVAFFLYTALTSFMSGLDNMNKGVWALWVAFIVDIFLTYSLINVLVDIGVNPQDASFLPYITVIVRFAISMWTRIIPEKEIFGYTNLHIFMPITMVLALIMFILALYLRRSRKGKGMFVEQAEVVFKRDRKHNLDFTVVLNIIMILFMLYLIISGIISDVNNELLANYGALKFVTVVKYMFWGWAVYRLSVNLYYVKKRHKVSMIKWKTYFLFEAVLIVDLMVNNADFINNTIMLIVWLLMSLIANAAIFYVND